MSQDPTLPSLHPSEMTAATVDLDRTYSLEEAAMLSDEALQQLADSLSDEQATLFQQALEQTLQEVYDSPLINEQQRLDGVHLIIDKLQADQAIFPGALVETPRGHKVKYFTGPRRQLLPPTPLAGSQAASSGSTAVDKPVRRIPTLTPQHLAMGAAAIGIGLCLIMGVIRSSADKPPTTAELTATAVAATQMALVPPTPTPLALENIDRSISAGQDLRNRYPVTLEIRPVEAAARIFPVQQQTVDIAEWKYDSNPDIATSILGLLVHPVLGIPYTPSNQTFLDALKPGDAITLNMSTGQSLNFSVSDSRRVQREDLSIFAQTTPGIAIVLLNDVARTRLVVSGRYAAGQEIAGQTTDDSETVIAKPGQTITDPTSGAALTIEEPTTSGGLPESPLSAEWRYWLVDVHVTTAHALDTRSIRFSLLDGGGTRYGPTQVEKLTDTPYVDRLLPENGTLDGTLIFLVPHSLTSAQLLTQATPDSAPIKWMLTIPPEQRLTSYNLDVLISSIETTQKSGDKPGQLSLRFRLYNAQAEAITVRPSDVFLIYSPTLLDRAFPVGPATAPSDVSLFPLTIKPDEAKDVEINFPWDGEPYVGITIGGYKYAAVLRQNP